MSNLRISQDKQNDVVKHVASCYQNWSDQLDSYKSRMERIYEAVSTFKENPKAQWQSTFKVNKAFEIENKTLPRIIANKPKWIVTAKTDEYNEGDRKLPPEERMKKYQEMLKYSDGIRDYLTHVFSKQDLMEVFKLWAKNMIRYGIGWTKIGYKYDVDREKYKSEEVYMDEDGNEDVQIMERVKEKVVNERPCIDISKRSDICYDPRNVRLEDFDGLVEEQSRIRLSFFTKNKKKYMNIDKLIDMCSVEYNPDDIKGYKQRIFSIAGIAPITDSKISRKNLTVKKYYGYYELKGENGIDEKLYEFWTVDDIILIYAREISSIPFEAIKCFDDTESFLATGFLEPVLGLQEEQNFKKNAASTYINQSLNRNWIWSPNSGVNPKMLNSAPGNIIPTTRDGQTAIANLIELPQRSLPANYFQEQNDFERQIQNLTFSIDTSSAGGNQAQTNLATGMKIKAYESNAVIGMVRDTFEDGLVKLAYKFLLATFENTDGNITIKKDGEEGFLEINREALRDAVRRYDIQIESGSSSYDTVESRRNDQITQWNIAQQAAAAGVPVNLEEQYKRLMGTFEGVDKEKLIKQQMPMGVPGMEGMMPGMEGGMPQGPAPQGIPSPQKPLTMPKETKAPGDIPI